MSGARLELRLTGHRRQRSPGSPPSRPRPRLSPAPPLRAGAERPLQGGHGPREEQAHRVGRLVRRWPAAGRRSAPAAASTTACWMTCQRSTAATWPPDSAWISSNASRWARISSLRRSLNSSPAPSPKAKAKGKSGGSSSLITVLWRRISRSACRTTARVRPHRVPAPRQPSAAASASASAPRSATTSPGGGPVASGGPPAAGHPGRRAARRRRRRPRPRGWPTRTGSAREAGPGALGQRVDRGRRLVDPDLVGAQHLLEALAQAGGGEGRLEHGRAAVGEHGQPPRGQALQRGGRPRGRAPGRARPPPAAPARPGARPQAQAARGLPGAPRR